MTSTQQSQSRRTGSGQCRRSNKGHWSAANIGVMVIGFLLWAPLGFAVLLWSLFGYPIEELPGWLRDRWRQLRGHTGGCKRSSDNLVFNEYQQAQHDRIDEIKEEIRHRATAFSDFRTDAKRRRDQEEFDAFMGTNPGQRPVSD